MDYIKDSFEIGVMSVRLRVSSTLLLAGTDAHTLLLMQ